MRIGLIGCGAIASMHVEALSRHEIVALCDVETAKAERLKEKYNLSCEIFSDYRQMLDCARLDSVHICTPHYLHTEMSIYALERNVHVLCEKPMSMNEEELLALQSAVKKSKAQFGVCFQNRYNESTLQAKAFLKDKTVLGGEGNIFWHRGDEYYLSSNWRGRLDKEGGSVLINQSIHTLDLLCYLIGAPCSVVATTANLQHQSSIDTEDVVAASYQCDNCEFTLFGTTNALMDKPAEIKIQAKDSRLWMVGNCLELNGEVTFENSRRLRGKNVWGNGHQALIADFYQSIANGTPFAVNFDEAATTHRAVFATYRSKGRRVEIEKR